MDERFYGITNIKKLNFDMVLKMALPIYKSLKNVGVADFAPSNFSKKKH